MRITIEDVARRAGVSIRTVSRVLNDRPDVAEETRQRVVAVIEELSYRPNSLARSMITGSTKTVGVVLPDIANPFFGRAVRGCEDLLAQVGYSIILCNTDEDLNNEQEYLALLTSRRVDGLILWGIRADCGTLESLLGPEIPVVIVDGSAFCGNSVSINVANQEGAREATQHLIELGHTRIAHLAGPRERVTAQRRLAGYQLAVEEAGLRPQEVDLPGAAVPSVPQGYEAALRILDQSARPTAILAYNDLMATGGLLAAKSLGIRVPEELAIVGFDDILMAAMVDPPLTTVRIAQYELGRLTGELLLERLDHPDAPPKAVDFPVELQVRGSSSTHLLSEEQQSALLHTLIESLSADYSRIPIPGERRFT